MADLVQGYIDAARLIRSYRLLHPQVTVEEANKVVRDAADFCVKAWPQMTHLGNKATDEMHARIYSQEQG